MNETGVLSASLTSPTHLGLKHPPSAVFPRARRDMDKVEAVDTGVDVAQASGSLRCRLCVAVDHRKHCMTALQ